MGNSHRKVTDLMSKVPIHAFEKKTQRLEQLLCSHETERKKRRGKVNMGNLEAPITRFGITGWENLNNFKMRAEANKKTERLIGTER